MFLARSHVIPLLLEVAGVASSGLARRLRKNLHPMIASFLLSRSHLGQGTHPWFRGSGIGTLSTRSRRQPLRDHPCAGLFLTHLLAPIQSSSTRSSLHPLAGVAQIKTLRCMISHALTQALLLNFHTPEHLLGLHQQTAGIDLQTVSSRPLGWHDEPSLRSSA